MDVADKNPLDRDWTMRSLLGFALPTMAMMLFMGLYTVVDTLFVARFVNEDALAAINIVCPVVNLTVGLGTMLATGGNAILSRKMGEGRGREAREDFTLLTLAGILLGLVLLGAGRLWMDWLLLLLGASPRLFPYCREYLSLLLLFLPATMLQTLYANLFVTAGRPGLGLTLSILAGLGNILLDYVFIALCGLGIGGAALGTGCGALIPSVAGLLYFSGGRGPLRFVKPRWRGETLWESCLNGSSELVSQLASALTTALFNWTVMDLMGEEGVAAITILIYTQFLLSALFIGFSMGVAPVLGFQYGSGNRLRQRRTLESCLGFLAAGSLLVFAAGRLGGDAIAALFAPGSPAVFALAAEGLSVFSYSFLFCGFNIFASALFTALSNGRVSAFLSFLRTFCFLAGGILLLPRFWGLKGLWLAAPAAEGLAFCLSAWCVFYYGRRELWGRG